jgi:lipopolysaccharide cholinephosphotransferase
MKRYAAHLYNDVNYGAKVRLFFDFIYTFHLFFCTFAAKRLCDYGEELDDSYPLPFGKVQDPSTTLIERPHLPYLGGVYIDVFPIDGVPNNSLLRRCHLIGYDILKKAVYMAYRDPYRHGKGFSSLLSLLCSKVIGRQRLQRATRHWLRKYSFADSNLVCVR